VKNYRIRTHVLIRFFSVAEIPITHYSLCNKSYYITCVSKNEGLWWKCSRAVGYTDTTSSRLTWCHKVWSIQYTPVRPTPVLKHTIQFTWKSSSLLCFNWISGFIKLHRNPTPIELLIVTSFTWKTTFWSKTKSGTVKYCSFFNIAGFSVHISDCRQRIHWWYKLWL
jgi:hypothetical protein